MKIIIGSDHNGYEKKKFIINNLIKLGYEIEDEGTNSNDSVDYPLYAKKVCDKVLNGNLGILICGTGIGMSICANKIKGIRCAKVDNKKESILSRMHNDANVIAVSSKKADSELLEIIESFLITNFSNEERHIRRNKEIENLLS